MTDQTADWPSPREQLLHAVDFAYCQTLGYATPEELLAAYDASRMPANQAPLRDRIAEAALAAVEAALGDTLVPAARAEALTGIAAELPAPADRPAVLGEAAAVLDRRASGIDAFSSSDFGEEARAVRELADAARELRRMADETATTETQARRGDAFEAWLKQQRDACFGHASSWATVDGLLDQYRLHADTGTPLGEHVCEAKVVGDCECLEQPAAGTRQDGSAS